MDFGQVSTILTKVLLYAGTLGAFGTVLCTMLFALQGTRAIAGGFAALGLLAAPLFFALQSVALTGDASGLTDPDMLSLLWATQAGTALRMQLGGLGVMVACLAWGRLAPIGMLGGLVAVGAFTQTGHIADLGRVTVTALLVFHLACAAFWMGILIPLKRLADNAATAQKAARLGQAFGRVATGLVPVLILAGIWMSYTLVGSTSALLGTQYGWTLLLKTCAVAALLFLAALNKLRFVPALARGQPTAARHLSHSILIECFVFAAVLTLTAVLTTSVDVPG